MKKNNKGFSLVELIVVVLILGILAVAISPQIMNWIDKSKEGKDEAYAGSVASATESVALEYLGRVGTLAEGTYKLNKDDGVVAIGGEANAQALDPNDSSIVLMEALADEIEAVVVNCEDPEQQGRDYYEIKVEPVYKSGSTTIIESVKVKVVTKEETTP